ncbi:MAG TPA: HNH endonuclease signature motif containing protein [Nocardioides sp.]|nr:HNH endonuclease signature motif containing protein [Nocardioides sp.]
MDLGKTGGVERLYDGLSPAELLESLNGEVKARRSSQLREWAGIIAWADANVVDAPEDAACLTVDGYLDTGIPIAGAGAPLVSEFGLMELIATLERSPDGGGAYVGQVIETAWRLPKINAEVLAGRCPTYRAAQVAELTRPLSAEAAAWVDAQLAFAVGRCTWAQIDRLIAEAIARLDPELAEAERKKLADQRHFDIDTQDLGINGLVHVHGVLDAADAQDLDEALGRRATLMGKLGHEGSMDVRRSEAAGEMARADLALDLEVVDEETGKVTIASAGRQAEVHVHITDATLGGLRQGDTDGSIGRDGRTNSPVLAEQVREWLQSCGTVIVRPVIDLADHVPVDSYEIPDRLRRQVELRDHHCAFPGCTRRASACDLDHAIPFSEGGPTCPCNLVPLCRRHHRAKTHSDWDYSVLEPGTYLWTSPTGRRFLVDPTGTRTLTSTSGGFEARKLAPQPPDE